DDLLGGVTLPAVRHDLTSLPARDRGQQDDSHNDWTYETGSAQVPKGQRRLGGLDDMIISLYAGGMTIRDIQHHLASTIGTDLSH
ncbi:transposase, partial [Micrococcus luteus]|uniref:transposase n=1 Tax=Micrococcus luteus TaxID=1270 RepID=UPI003CE6D341